MDWRAIRILVWAGAALGLSGCALLGVPPVDGCHQVIDDAGAAKGEAALARFVVMGDFGSEDSGHNVEVAAAMRRFAADSAQPVHRVFELGDNFYPRGLVGTDGNCDEYDAQDVAAQARGVVMPFDFIRDRGLTLTLVPGNHDHYCGDEGLDNQRKIDRWLAGAEPWGVQWDLRTGEPQEIILNDAVQVVLLDSYLMIHDTTLRSEFAERLQHLLSRGDYRWRIVAAHHPLYTYGTHNGAWWQGTVPRLTSLVLFPLHVLAAFGVPGIDVLNEEAYTVRYVAYRRAVERAIADSGARVDLFMGGHDHQLQLLDRVRDDQPLVLVSGSASKCSPVYAADRSLFAAAKSGFGVVAAYKRHLDIELYGTTPCDVGESCAYAEDGRAHLLYRHRIPR